MMKLLFWRVIVARRPLGALAQPRRGHPALLVTAVLLTLQLAQARQVTAAEPLRYDLRVDIPVTAVATAAWLTSELFKDRLAHQTCQWCDSVPGVDTSVRNALKWQETATPNTWSNVTGFALSPLLALGGVALAAHQEGTLGNAGIDMLIVAEATALAADLNQFVKFAVGRERPFVHALAAADKGKTAHPADNNMSFYSGHTNLVFALAVSSGTVASLRGYRWAPAVWGSGLAMAATTGYLRIAADKHYFTDVMLGAVTGSAIGFAVPYFLHRGSSSGSSSGAVPAVSGNVGTTGGGLSVAWGW